MNPISIADIPFALSGVIITLGFNDILNINPLIMLFAWVFIITSSIFLMFANVISGGYKNDWHRNEAMGERWREGLIAIALILGFFALPVTQFLWDRVGSPNIQLLFIIIVACLALSYLNVKLRYRIFQEFTPEKKENPIKLSDLSKYLRWYHWLMLFTFFLFSLPYIFGGIN